MPGFEFLAQWGAAVFCSRFLALSGLLGAGMRSSAFADWRGRGVRKVSFLGKRVGNAA